jgi:hypothetical protein
MQEPDIIVCPDPADSIIGTQGMKLRLRLAVSSFKRRILSSCCLSAGFIGPCSTESLLNSIFVGRPWHNWSKFSRSKKPDNGMLQNVHTLLVYSARVETVIEMLETGL